MSQYVLTIKNKIVIIFGRGDISENKRKYGNLNSESANKRQASNRNGGT